MVWFMIATGVFIVVSLAMVGIILVQRPQGGGLAGAFGGAGGAGTDTVFGGRVGDALTWATVIAFLLYIGLAIGLTKLQSPTTAGPTTAPATPTPLVTTAQPEVTTTRPSFTPLISSPPPGVDDLGGRPPGGNPPPPPGGGDGP